MDSHELPDPKTVGAKGDQVRTTFGAPAVPSLTTLNDMTGLAVGNQGSVIRADAGGPDAV